jgi:hypothetical protein
MAKFSLTINRPFSSTPSDSHSTLLSKGFKLSSKTPSVNTYDHPTSGHSYTVYQDGSWAHFVNDKKQKQGYDHKELTNHLSTHD